MCFGWGVGGSYFGGPEFSRGLGGGDVCICVYVCVVGGWVCGWVCVWVLVLQWLNYFNGVFTDHHWLNAALSKVRRDPLHF